MLYAFIYCGCSDDSRTIDEVSNYPVIQDIYTESRIWSIDWNNSQNLIAIGTHSSTRIYDFDSDSLNILQNQPGIYNYVRWGGVNDNILAGTKNDVWVYDGNTMMNISDLSGDFRFYEQIGWNHDSSLLSGLYIRPRPAPSQLHIWNLPDGDLQQNIENVSRYSWGQDDMLAYSLQNNTSVYLLANYQSSESIELFNFEANVNSLSWNPLNTQLASTSVDGRLVVWDFNDGEIIFETGNLPTNVFSIKWNPSGDLISIASEEGTIVVCLATESRILVHETQSQDITWHSEQAVLATAQDESLVIYDVSQIVDACE